MKLLPICSKSDGFPKTTKIWPETGGCPMDGRLLTSAWEKVSDKKKSKTFFIFVWEEILLMEGQYWRSSTSAKWKSFCHIWARVCAKGWECKHSSEKISAWYGLEDESTCTRFNKCKYLSIYCSEKINTPTLNKSKNPIQLSGLNSTETVQVGSLW